MNTPIEPVKPASKLKQDAKDGLAHVTVSSLVKELTNRGYQVELRHVPHFPHFTLFAREGDDD